MDQEVEIINTETRKEKIKNFIVNKKKKNNCFGNFCSFDNI